MIAFMPILQIEVYLTNAIYFMFSKVGLYVYMYRIQKTTNILTFSFICIEFMFSKVGLLRFNLLTTNMLTFSFICIDFY